MKWVIVTIMISVGWSITMINTTSEFDFGMMSIPISIGAIVISIMPESFFRINQGERNNCQ